MSTDRSFTNDEARAAWNEGAEAWDAFLETDEDRFRDHVFVPVLEEACGELKGRRVLDIGCGQGRFARRLAQHGAQVVGVDLAERQLENARKHEKKRPLGIEYHLMDAARLSEQWKPGSFDVVVSLMSLHDMSDPKAAAVAAANVLVPGGRLAVSIPHPFVDTPYRKWEICEDGTHGARMSDRYFESEQRKLNWNMGRLKYHWETPYYYQPVSAWSALFDQAGFLIRRLYEPRPTPEQITVDPGCKDAERLPFVLIFALTKR